LNFKAHYKLRLQKARLAETRLKSLSSTQGLAPGLIRRIQIAAVQSVALYGAELWWRGQKTWAQDIQKLVNKQARAITGALKTTPIAPLIREANLTPADPLLDDKQRKYALRALKLPSDHPINSILPPTLRYGDGEAQPGEYSTDNLQWAGQETPKNIGQRLARKLTENLSLDPSEGFETTCWPKGKSFPGEIIIQQTKEAEIEARQPQNGLVYWTDGSRLDTAATGAGIAWKSNRDWREKAISLGKTKEVFDAELYGIQEALKLAYREHSIRRTLIRKVIIFSDSQAALKRA
jgi:hypothetical protein